MMKKIIFTGTLYALLLAFTACGNPDLTPTYLVISEESLQNPINLDNYNNIHDASYDSYQLNAIGTHRFTDVWVYVNGEKLGCWEVPCKIPVLNATDAPANISIVPGVRMNGLSTTIPRYPFVEMHTRTVTLNDEGNYDFSDQPIQFSYYNNVTFPLLETFENSTSFIADSSGAPIVIQSYDNGNVGAVTLNSTHNSFELTSQSLSLPQYGNYIFLEITYKCDAEFYVGVITPNSNNVNEQQQLVGVNASTPNSDEWKTIYINLTQAVSRYTTSLGWTNAEVVFNSLYAGDGIANFYFKNVKVVYMN